MTTHITTPDAVFRVHPATATEAPMAVEVTAFLVVEHRDSGNWKPTALLLDFEDAQVWIAEATAPAFVLMLPYETAWRIKRAGSLTRAQGEALRDVAMLDTDGENHEI